MLGLENKNDQNLTFKHEIRYDFFFLTVLLFKFSMYKFMKSNAMICQTNVRFVQAIHLKNLIFQVVDTPKSLCQTLSFAKNREGSFCQSNAYSFVETGDGVAYSS